MRPWTMSFSRFAAISALFSAPGLVVIALLAGLGLIGVGTAALAMAAVVPGVTGAVYFYFRDALIVAEYLDRLTEGEDVRPPHPVSELGRALTGTVARLHRGWRQRERSLTAQVTAAAGLIEALPDPFMVLNRRRTVVRANGAAFAQFGDKLVGRDLADLVRHPQVLAAVDAVRDGGGPRTIEFSRPVPVEQVLEARVKPFVGALDNGSGSGAVETGADEPAVMLTFHDITAIKRSEQMRADFVANASHELRTPLATLIGFIETLRGPARDDAGARDRFLAIMEEQAGRMSRLINDLLSLSRIELDEHTLPGGQVDLLAVVRSVIDTLEMQAEARDMKIVLQAPEALPPVLGDPDQLTQVFQNLVDNAIKYARAGTEVTVSASGPQGRGRGHLSIAVRDRGDGIARNHLPRLTERFYRVDPARSRALGGTGLGLAIAKHIVSRHRGRLSIDSEVGKGSVFTVTLPTASAARTAPPAPAPAETDAI